MDNGRHELRDRTNELTRAMKSLLAFVVAGRHDAPDHSLCGTGWRLAFVAALFGYLIDISKPLLYPDWAAYRNYQNAIF